MADHLSLPGVPESITRADYLRLVESVGLDVNELESLEFRSDGIYANVYATDEHGRRMAESAGWVGRGLSSAKPAMHRVFIRVAD